MVNPLKYPELLDGMNALESFDDAFDVPMASYRAKTIAQVCYFYHKYTRVPFDEARFTYRAFPDEGVYEISLKPVQRRSAPPAPTIKKKRGR